MFDIEKEREIFEKQAFLSFYLANLIFDCDENIYRPNESLIRSGEDWEWKAFRNQTVVVNTAWASWQASTLLAEEKLKGCVVVPKDQIETWWQDAEEPENFASTIESIPALGENLGDKEIMEIDEHHTIHLPSKRIYGTWFEKDGERSFVTGSLEECRAMVEAARGGNE